MKFLLYEIELNLITMVFKIDLGSRIRRKMFTEKICPQHNHTCKKHHYTNC